MHAAKRFAAKRKLKKELLVHPTSFGPGIKSVIRKKLLADVEGFAQGKDGFLITVTDIRDEDIGRGMIEDTTGFVKYIVKYTAIVFRPFRNEILDAIVTSVNSLGFYAAVGPLTVFVSRQQIPSAGAGILSFNHETSSFESVGGDLVVQRGSGVRLKIMGIKVDATNITAIGTIKSDTQGGGLGVLLDS